MPTVKIYKITVTKAWDIRNTGKFASLSAWKGNTMTDEGWDDEGKLYKLPTGYTVGTAQDDHPALFDAEGYRCELDVKDGEVYVYPAYGGRGLQLRQIEAV